MKLLPPKTPKPVPRLKTLPEPFGARRFFNIVDAIPARRESVSASRLGGISVRLHFGSDVHISKVQVMPTGNLLKRFINRFMTLDPLVFPDIDGAADVERDGFSPHSQLFGPEAKPL